MAVSIAVPDHTFKIRSRDVLTKGKDTGLRAGRTLTAVRKDEIANG
ncbi:MAG TPA: hypothetical protein VKP30_01000 [Polyangiaceae bacterium]|nr:hypothetical protein [Polyangiaceae bacterium]